MSYAIARKPTELMPSGKACGYGGVYPTREIAQAVLAAKKSEGWNWADEMQVIETNSEIETAKSGESNV